MLLAAATLSGACAPRLRPRPAINPDRPSYSDGVAVISPGTTLLTVGASESRTNDTRVQVFGEGLLRVGVHSRMELRLQPNSWIRQRAGDTKVSGLQDARVGIKASLLAPATSTWHPAVSMVLMSSLPSGGREIGAHVSAQPEAKVVLASQPHPRFGITANVAYLHAVSDDRRVAIRSVTLLASYALTSRIGMYSEVLGTRAPRDSRRYHDAGLTFRLTNDTQLDAWIGNRAGIRERAAGVGFARQW